MRSGGIEALYKKPGQGRRPKLSPANPNHVERGRSLVEINDFANVSKHVGARSLMRKAK